MIVTARTPKLLDDAQIAARRIPIETAEINLGRDRNWQCHYCSGRFASETTFLKHHCEAKRRAQEVMSPLGMAAHGYYREWMRVRKYSQPNAAAFLESKYYRAFINFAQMVQDANIAKPEKYIALMAEANILPILWCRDATYTIYLDWADRVNDPLDQVQESINYLLDICEQENVLLQNVFSHLGANRVLSLIRQRRLSPWLLFCAGTFGHFLKSLDRTQLSAFNTVVTASYWAAKFEREQDTVGSIKSIARELGL